ncbi:helix-turn-helix domain-containing protein [Streptomyces jeddahensis]|uniref:helix-turn-helix domain-containing protein n=1 Tax=Streptomyces jeddahensis TaxID=1716141 RepID=UPI00099012EA|nr:helix-turn-helix domain-containing protein [Streptomyces jeddahensis]
MGRPESELDPAAGPVEEFAHELRRLRERTGRTPYRDLAKRANFSASALSSAAAGQRLPSWPVVSAFVRASLISLAISCQI